MADLNIADNSATNAAKDLLGKKYGPLPFGAWLLIAAGVAYATRRLIKGQQDANAAAPESAYVLDSQGNKYPSAYTGTGGGVPFGSGSVSSAGVSGSSTATPPTEINNESWFRRAVEKLAQAGMWDTVTVQQSLMKYISGGKLDQRESAIVAQAIKMEGVPPVNISVGAGSSGSGATPVRIVKPAGNAGQFIQWSSGALTWIRDPNEMQALKNSLGKDFNYTPVILPIGDPIWMNADVYQQRSREYLETEAMNKKNWQETAYGPSAGTIYSLNAG